MDRRPATVLVIDDDRSLGRLLRDYLQEHGHRTEVLSDPLAGLAAARSHRHQALVLDIMMPRLDGHELCARIREFSSMPVIMLSARDEAADRVRSFELGADDHLGKPFDPRELLMRLRAVTRRLGGGAAPAIKAAGLELDLRRSVVRQRRGAGPPKQVPLSPSEFAVLALLAKHGPEPVRRDDVFALLRGFDRSAVDRSIDVMISRLRRKLGDDHRRPRYIKTVRNVGYAFIG